MKKLITFILFVLLFNPFGLFTPILKFTSYFFRDILLKCNGRTTRATIIDEINDVNHYTFKREFTYSYLFKVDGKKYKSDSEDSTLKIGDTLKVEYFKNYPSIHKVLHLKQ